jgi:hypothetical protein
MYCICGSLFCLKIRLTSSQMQLRHLKKFRLTLSLRHVFGLNLLELPDKTGDLNLSLSECSPSDFLQTLGPYLSRLRAPHNKTNSPVCCFHVFWPGLETFPTLWCFSARFPFCSGDASPNGMGLDPCAVTVPGPSSPGSWSSPLSPEEIYLMHENRARHGVSD